MNRSILFAFLFSLWCFHGEAQIFLCNQVIGSTGKSATLGNLHFAYTVGEPVIATVSNNSRKLTQGFHQPDICLITGTETPFAEALGLELYPVPTDGLLHIQFRGNLDGSYKARVYDLLGKVILSDFTIISPDGAGLDCTTWQPGIYFLQLTSSNGRAATVRFIRI